jgi:hypothetical protein
MQDKVGWGACEAIKREISFQVRTAVAAHCIKHGLCGGYRWHTHIQAHLPHNTTAEFAAVSSGAL